MSVGTYVYYAVLVIAGFYYSVVRNAYFGVRRSRSARMMRPIAGEKKEHQ
jgi:hypothetical protein